ncbi:hypothetical protein OG914_15325 [Streptomyces sp. NBC_00291]|uniref:hypothetical protein n=1 Tax=Streptomyces sp. NBC_00291 TaxID=2975704 RepID=UPI00224E1498|nr:hypothetical protein [Streptomyces sp. NBC_00291]MCX5155356.1 hypothetical protein [Streptomyces sp. NBC_00291]
MLVGRDDQGREICGPCSGSDIAFSCVRCGFPGDIYAGGCCTRCVVKDRVHDLLAQDNGVITPQLLPLAQSLTTAEHPRSIRGWLSRSPAAKLLATLVSAQAEITHEHLDTLPQDPNLRYIRDLLVATKVLPRRHEIFARLELWAAEILAARPRHQLSVLRPFVEWQIVRDARRRAARDQYTAGAASGDRLEIRSAFDFMDWLDKTNLELKDVTQADLDLWLEGIKPSRREGVASFLRWTAARRLTINVSAPRQPVGMPSRFQAEDEHARQLRRCLNDDTLPLPIRIIGALIRLYGLPTTRIITFTTDLYRREEDGAYFTFGRHPVLLPPKLARLIEDQIAQPRIASAFRPTADDTPAFLFPGQPPSRPRSANSVHQLMKKHGLPIIEARNTAMIEAASDLPPIVISDLFGVGATTAETWAKYAQDSWADYLAACEEDD